MDEHSPAQPCNSARLCRIAVRFAIANGRASIYRSRRVTLIRLPEKDFGMHHA
jgi:isocitrate dehydrogenase